jgi:hypothetical protein
MHASWNARKGLHIYRWLFLEFHTQVQSAEETQMASKENKHKYADKEEVSSEEEPTQWAHFDESDTTNSEKDDDNNDDGSDDDYDNASSNNNNNKSTFD